MSVDQSTLIRAAVERSGLGMGEWIRTWLIPRCGITPPSERTVYRWLSGETEMPAGVRELLERWTNEEAKRPRLLARREGIGKGEG